MICYKFIATDGWMLILCFSYCCLTLQIGCGIVPVKYIQIALSIETMLDLSTLTIKDVTGSLRAVESSSFVLVN